jgi:predicted GTPase
MAVRWQCSTAPFHVVIVGKTGSGKTTLVNNIFKDMVLAKVGHSLQSETLSVKEYSGKLGGVLFRIYDTPALSLTIDSSAAEEVSSLLESRDPEIDLTLFCMSIANPRLDQSQIQVLRDYNSIGLKWEKTILALTFADEFHVTPKDKANRDKHFPHSLKNWIEHIRTALQTNVGLPSEVTNALCMFPTTALLDESLPNGEDWLFPLKDAIIKALPAKKTDQPQVVCHDIATLSERKITGIQSKNISNESILKAACDSEILHQLDKKSNSVTCWCWQLCICKLFTFLLCCRCCPCKCLYCMRKPCKVATA